MNKYLKENPVCTFRAALSSQKEWPRGREFQGLDFSPYRKGGRRFLFIEKNYTPCKPVLDRKKLQNTSLSKKELSIILGGLLGDGSLKMYTGYKNARYSFRHSAVQKPYFNYKTAALASIASEKSIQVQKPDGWSGHQKLLFCSRALPCLSEIHSITHVSNSIKIQRRWLNHCTAESLSIWWFDDGSIVGGGRQGCLSTDGFTLEEIKILVQYLKVVWKIEGRIHPVKKNEKSARKKTLCKGLSTKQPLLPPCSGINVYYRIYFSTGVLKKFLTIILPYVYCKETLYKCTLKYKDSKLQERWISHMTSLLPLNTVPFLKEGHILREKKRMRKEKVAKPLPNEKMI